MKRLISLLFFCLLSCLFLQAGAAHADGRISVNSAEIEKTEDGYRLSSAFTLELTPRLEDALMRGIPLYFTTELEITRPRWYWFDEKPVSASRTIRVSYNVLTRQYGVTVVGNLQQNVQSLDEALNIIRRPQRWLFADHDVLKTGETYMAAIRMQLDVSYLPKPFQINVINNSNWRLSTEWKRFSFEA